MPNESNAVIQALLSAMSPKEPTSREKIQNSIGDILTSIGAGLANRGRGGSSSGAGAALMAGTQRRDNRAAQGEQARQQALQNALQVANFQRQGQQDQIVRDTAQREAALERGANLPSSASIMGGPGPNALPPEARAAAGLSPPGTIQAPPVPSVLDPGIPSLGIPPADVPGTVNFPPQVNAAIERAQTNQTLMDSEGIKAGFREPPQPTPSSIVLDAAGGDPKKAFEMMNPAPQPDISSGVTAAIGIFGQEAFANMSPEQKIVAIRQAADAGKGTSTPTQPTRFDQELDLFKNDPKAFREFMDRDPEAGLDLIANSPLTEISPEDTLWNRLGWFTTSMISLIPRVAGTLTGMGEKSIATIQAFTSSKNTMLRALAENPRFQVGEQNRLAAELDIQPNWWDAPDTIKVRMREIDKHLKSLEERRLATGDQAAVLAIRQFRMQMGVPDASQPKAGDTEENDGARYRFNGEVWELIN